MTIMFHAGGWIRRVLGSRTSARARQRRRSLHLTIERLEDRSLLANAHLAVIGDFGNASAGEASVAAQLKTTNPEFVITVGDNNYTNNGAGAGWDTAIGNYYHEFIRYPATGSGSTYAPDGATPHVQPASNQFFPSLGNHDWDAGVTGYTNYFELPGNERYYDYVKGPIHFFVLDSDSREPDGRTIGSTQYNWFANAIAASTSEWQVVYFHHAAYSSGNHGNTTAMQWDFVAKGVDAVLQGHDHHYERLSVGGIPYFVNGVGGAEIREFPNIQPGSQVRYNSDYGFMVVDASDTSMTFQFITDDGVVIDTYTLSDIPNAPAGLTATAVSNSRINLAWSDASNNETGIKVERSTNNVDFAVVANLGANVTSYADQTGLSPATTYYYRVKATSALGDSLASNVANATTLAANIATPVVVGATWKYLDNGTNQGTAWRATSFNDAAWSSGAAQLGYGDGGEQTVVGYGGNASNKYVTTYFRNTFNLANASAFSTLNLRLLRDDGAVVYLNGTEVFRSNMPTGTIGYQTLASAAIGGADESTFYSASISPSLLVNGDNTLAVEIHQANVTSSDISFDAELSGTVNIAPALSQPANQTLNNNQTLPVTLSVTDLDTPAASLVYTASYDDYGYLLKQQYGFGAESTATYNWGGQQEKWFKQTSGTNWYFITPNGNFYRWGGGTPAQLLTTSTLLAQLHTVYYTTTARLGSATSIAATAPVNNSSPPAVLTVDPPDTFVGTLRYQVSVSDGTASDAKTFYATVNSSGAPANQAPVLSQPGNQTLNNNQTLPVTLSVSDPDTPAASLVYSASLDDMGYVLRQQYSLGAESISTYNWGGQQEKWFKQTNGTNWYFITPNGNFYRWGGGTPAQLLTTSTLSAQLHTVYYTTTTRISAAASIAASAPVNNSSPPAVLTVDPPDTFVGTLRYQVSVSDGTSSDAKTFSVTVNSSGAPTNQAPVLTQPANQTLNNNQTLPVPLSVTDPDTSAASLVYSASFDDMGYVLRQQHSLGAESISTYNWGGQQEKWFKQTNGTNWYFITPNGNFYRWGGGTPAQLLITSTLLAQLHTVYYTTTTRISGAASIATTAPVNNSSPPAVLTVDPPDTFVGTLRYQVSVSDGSSSDAKTFYVTVNSSGAPTSQAPVLTQPADQTLNNNQTLPVTLSVTDPDTPAANLIYTASYDDYGYLLKQQYGFGTENTATYNWGGQQEKWFRQVSGSTVIWYFITPNGNFYRWGGGTPAQLLTTSTMLAQLHTVYYTTTARLGSATSIAATAPVNNSSPPAVLTVDPPDTFVGTLRYQVSVSDGTASDAKTFLVRVN